MIIRLTLCAIRQIVVTVTPKSAATICRESPTANRRRISATFASLNLHCPWRSPFGLESGCVQEPFRAPLAVRSGRRLDQWLSPVGTFNPLVARPFATISAELSACVPRNKCSGLQHDGLSHRWHTSIPCGIGPTKIDHANRCANTRRTPSLKAPYPKGVFAAVQFQHGAPDSLSNLRKNRSIGFLAGCDILGSKSRDLRERSVYNVVLRTARVRFARNS